MIRIGGVPSSLIFIVLAVGDGLLSLYRSERRDKLFIGTRPPTPLVPVPNKPHVGSVDLSITVMMMVWSLMTSDVELTY